VSTDSGFGEPSPSQPGLEPAAVPAPAPAPTAGGLLRAARERQGIHVAALAAAIKVAPRKLEALEADRLDELPGLVFTRGLAGSVCRTLKIDSQPVLALLPQIAPQARLALDEGLAQPLQAMGAPPVAGGPAWSVGPGRLLELWRHPMLWGALLLLVASVALYLVPLSAWKSPKASSAVPPPAAGAASAPGAREPGGAAAAGRNDAAGSGLAAVGEPAASAAANMASAAMAAASTPSVPVAVAPAPALPALAAVLGQPAPTVTAGAISSPALASRPLPPVPAGPSTLQLRVREASWIDVRDALGQSVVSRVVQPGERLALEASPPLSLVVGNAGATELVFRGKPIDLAARTRDNVARFQLP